MSDSNHESDSNSPGSNPRGFQNAVDHMMAHKIDALLWMTRLGTVVFTILYLIPLFGVNTYSCYQRALMSNAATSALRLHQRLPNVRLSRNFLALLLIEDSCHYLFYSLIFLYNYPVTLVLLPVFLFAILHSTSFTITVMDKLGWNHSWETTLTSLVEQHQRTILRLVAFSEIFLMPLTIFMVFSGKGNLLTPFIYYRFLTLRYASRRNPYTRTVFHELRLIIEVYANRPECPQTIRQLAHKVISFVSRLAPPVPAQ